MKKSFFLFFTVVGVFSMLLILLSNSTGEKPEETVNETADSLKVEMKISSVDFKGELNFAGERVPLEDIDVKERLDRELHINTYWHSSTILMMKLSNKYFPEIEKILAEKGVPDDFKYLSLAESGLRNVVSPAKAVGFWQMLKGTGIEYGLEVNEEVDERYDYLKSTEAACKYFLKAKEKFDNWTLAAAAYNMGMGGVNKNLTNQKVDSYYDLYLNTETSRYVFRVLALKEIFINPEKYGFNLDKEDLYDPVEIRTIEVDSAILSLAAFAQNEGTTYKNVKLLNPWLRKPYLKNRYKKSYQIDLPVNKQVPSESE